jgi:hypothetical protein
MKVWREVNQKPPLGAVADPSHWRTQCCAGRYLLNEGAGQLFRALVGPTSYVVNGHMGAEGLVTTNTSIQYGDIPNGHLPLQAPLTLDFAFNISAYGHYVAAWVDLGARYDILIFSANATSLRSIIRRPASNRWDKTITCNVLGSHRVIIVADLSGQTIYWDNVGTWDNSVSTQGYYSATLPLTLFNHGNRSGTGSPVGALLDFSSYPIALSAAQVREIYEEPYGGLLVPGLARIFDMGAGGVPIGAIRTRFPALTGGLRI